MSDWTGVTGLDWMDWSAELCIFECKGMNNECQRGRTHLVFLEQRAVHLVHVWIVRHLVLPLPLHFSHFLDHVVGKISHGFGYFRIWILEDAGHAAI